MKHSKLFKLIFPHTALSFLTANTAIDLADRFIESYDKAKQSISLIYQPRPFADWPKLDVFVQPITHSRFQPNPFLPG